MVFYQAMLLGGYLYAHALTKFLKPRTQAAVHWVALALSLMSLPVGLDRLQAPDAAGPGWMVVEVLFRTIGIPYCLLSSTSPLLQAWYAQLYPDGRAYRLFGWSNLSCALALLSFPFVLEPLLALRTLNLWWSWGYGGTALLLAVSAALVWRQNGQRKVPAGEAPAGETPGWRQHAQWLFFSALGSILLMGVTNHLCQMIAPIPFLWTVPLLVYLLTFVACFEREWYTRARGVGLAGAALLAMGCVYVYLPPGQVLGPGIPIYSAGLFFTCFFCHGELALRKPGDRHLTEFYVMIAAGGALGSLLVAFGAPALFTQYAEFPIAMVLCAMAMLMTVYGKRLLTDLLVTGCAVAVAVLALAPMLSSKGRIAASRNFHGSLRVEEFPPKDGHPGIRKLVHGSINHGEQYMDAIRSREPLSYYTPSSGAGQVLARMREPRRIGLIGLGTGSLVAYGRPGDVVRIYELNPMVVDYAQRYFSYLSHTPAVVEIRTGDGRLLLDSEPAQDFDVLAVDAFSGESIPVHLLTRQAMRIYRRHTKPTGIIALHLSNLYMDLEPLVRAVAEAEGLEVIAVNDPGDQSRRRMASIWALAGTSESLRGLGVAASAVSAKRVKPWTDDESSLLTVLR